MCKAKKDRKAVAQKSRVPRKALQLAGANALLAKGLDDVTPIVEFLENFRKLADPSAQLPSKLISIKIPVPLLEAFKFKAGHVGVPYQTMIKRLMQQWLSKPDIPAKRSD